MKHLLERVSLLQALIIMIIISIIVPQPLLFGTYVHSAYKAKQEAIYDINMKKFNLSSEIFAESLWNYYPELGQKLLNQLTFEPNVLSITVTDADKKDFLTWKSTQDEKNSEVIVFEKVLEKNGKIIGFFEMRFKKLGILESFINDMSNFGSMLILQAIFLAIIISFIYVHKVIRPMRRLVYHSSLLSEQKLDSPFGWRANDEIGTLGVALEETRIKLKGLFENLKGENARLDAKVQERTQELERTSQYKSEFLANMSHEIRTPMNAIMGMTHLMSKTAMNATQSNYVTKIKEASSVLLHIINDILDFSKIEAGKMDVESVVFDLHKELKKSYSIFSVLTKEKGIGFETDFIETHRFFKGDPYKMMQIINNFLSNAIKFTSQGGVKLCVKETHNDTEFATLVFSVKDSGVGIAKEKQAQLFKAFGQLDSSITRKHGGTGLGLYICTQLSQMMNGKIDIYSEENKGSTFTFTITLPIAQGSQLHHEKLSRPFEPLNVLLIEDDTSLATSLIDIIRSFGFFVKHFTSKEDVISEFKGDVISHHLMIIDYDLAQSNGALWYEMLKTSINASLLPPIIMLASEDTQTFKSKLIGYGINALLKKPVNPSMLYDEITTLCEVYRQEPLFDPSRIDLSKKSILVVEDNDINLEVALYLLKDTHINVDVAHNGLEAVAQAKEKVFDLILMDIQMPLMDGYEATRIIRNELKITTPIVAMTANVMAHDIDKCIKIGMDAHIGKPFEVEDFYGTLLEVLHVSIKNLSKQSEEKPVVSFNKQDAIKQLGGNEALWTKIFCSFYEHYLDAPVAIKNLIARNELTVLIDYIHTLKGLCGTLGASTLQKESAKIESFLKENGTIEGLNIDVLLQEHKILFSLLMHEYEQTAPVSYALSEGKNENTQEVMVVLEALKNALETSSVSKINAFLDDLSVYEDVCRRPRFKEMMLACTLFDFETAEVLIEDLKKELSNG